MTEKVDAETTPTSEGVANLCGNRRHSVLHPVIGRVNCFVLSKDVPVTHSCRSWQVRPE